MARRPSCTFTAEVETKVVLDLLAGHTKQAEACRKHQLSPTLVALWKAILLERLSATPTGAAHLGRRLHQVGSLLQRATRVAEGEGLWDRKGMVPGITTCWTRRSLGSDPRTVPVHTPLREE